MVRRICGLRLRVSAIQPRISDTPYPRSTPPGPLFGMGQIGIIANGQWGVFNGEMAKPVMRRQPRPLSRRIVQKLMQHYKGRVSTTAIRGAAAERSR